MPDRPNVLVLMDDEHRPSCLGYAGNDVVRTPTLDRLAADACVFENAYTPSPRCVPARQCLMTGELPRTCGCLGWGQGLDGDEPTVARRLRAHGYRTALAGKSHFVGGSAFLGFGTRIGDVKSDEAIDRQTEREAPTRKWTDAKEIKRAGPAVGRNERRDDRAVRGTIDYVEREFVDAHYDRATPERPTLLAVSLRQPHYPYHAPDEERFRYYLNRVDPAVESAPDHDGLSAREVTIGRDGFGWDDQNEPDGDWADVTEREVRRATAAYYAMVERVDDHVERVLDALDRAGQDVDEWIVVFCSDHGEMLGEHGVWEKGSFYEASAGVPLFVRWPDRFDGSRVTRNVSLCDLYATLCELTGVPVRERAARDSRSLVPLLEGDRDAWDDNYPRDEVVSAEWGRIMVKRGDFKYVHFPDDEFTDGDVLFDLSRDPDERVNAIDRPEHGPTVAAFRERVTDLGYGPAADPNYEDAGYT
jgi:choline-sulfatase